jgi:hypothetical protein
MPYRQIWDIGQGHVQELRHHAAVERVRRQARPDHAMGRPLAVLVRVAADSLLRLADRLEPRPIHRRHGAHTVSSRPGGA